MQNNGFKALFAHPAVAILALLVAPVGLYHWSQQALSQQDAPETEAGFWTSPTPSSTGAVQAATPGRWEPPTTLFLHQPGVRPQAYYSANVEGIYGDEEVIGVIVAGKPRAYLLEALRELQKCLVNDVVGDRPISVVYNDASGDVRVFTGLPQADENAAEHVEAAGGSIPEPLPLEILGIYQGRVSLWYGKRRYYADEDLPLADHPYFRSTWKKWKQAYPDTDLFAGDVLAGIH